LSGTDGPRAEPYRSSQTFVTTDESRPLQERDVHVVGRRVLACLFDCSLVLTPALAALTIVAFVGRPGPAVVLILLLLALLAWCALYLRLRCGVRGLSGPDARGDVPGNRGDPGRGWRGSGAGAGSAAGADVHVCGHDRGSLGDAVLTWEAASRGHGREHPRRPQETAPQVRFVGPTSKEASIFSGPQPKPPPSRAGSADRA
jgi:hypothetical protein